MKCYDKNKESAYIQYWDINNLYGQAIPPKNLQVNNFELIEYTSKFNGDFIKHVVKRVMKEIFLMLMFNIFKNYMKFIMICHFYQKE